MRCSENCHPDALSCSLQQLREAASREAAARALLHEVRVIAGRAFRAANREGKPRLTSEQEDFVQQVVIKLFEQAVVGKEIPRNPRSYVWRMLRNSQTDWYRARTREREGLERLRSFHEAAGQVSARFTAGDEKLQAEAIAAEMTSLFARLVNEAASSRSERYRDAFRRDVEELVAVATGSKTMRDLLRGAGLESAAAPHIESRLRNRLLQRHSRARKELKCAAERLANSGTLDETESRTLESLIARLFRCQRREPQSVEGDTEKPGLEREPNYPALAEGGSRGQHT